MATLNREIYHHPSVRLPEKSAVKLEASRAIMEEGSFESSFYFVPSEGQHHWLCDIILNDGWMKEALNFKEQRAAIAKQNARDLQQTIDARTLNEKSAKS